MIKYALLGLLREKPDHGYQLKKRFDERLGSLWQLNAGQVYQTLQALARAGLVVEVTLDDDAPDPNVMRPRRVFDLTAKGKRALDRWLERTPRHARPARDETLLRLLVLSSERHAEAAAQGLIDHTNCAHPRAGLNEQQQIELRRRLAATAIAGTLVRF